MSMESLLNAQLYKSLRRDSSSGATEHTVGFNIYLDTTMIKVIANPYIKVHN